MGGREDYGKPNVPSKYAKAALSFEGCPSLRNFFLLYTVGGGGGGGGGVKENKERRGGDGGREA
jgi:hypothetical protein